MSKYALTPQALDDLFDIWSFIARDNLKAAKAVEEAIYLVCDLLVQTPLAGNVRKDLTALRVRFWRVQPYPNYLIAYDPEKTPIQIVRIIHGARNLPSFLA